MGGRKHRLSGFLTCTRMRTHVHTTRASRHAHPCSAPCTLPARCAVSPHASGLSLCTRPSRDTLGLLPVSCAWAPTAFQFSVIVNTAATNVFVQNLFPIFELLGQIFLEVAYEVEAMKPSFRDSAPPGRQCHPPRPSRPAGEATATDSDVKDDFQSSSGVQPPSGQFLELCSDAAGRGSSV